jgi:hypothetical protein
MHNKAFGANFASLMSRFPQAGELRLSTLQHELLEMARTAFTPHFACTARCHRACAVCVTTRVLQVLAALLASSAEYAHQPTADVVNGSSPSDGPPALLDTLHMLLNPESTTTSSAQLTEAALDAVGQLGSTASGADLVFTSPQGLAITVAALAFHRTST